VTFTRGLQRTFFITGLFLCLFYAGSLAYRALGSRAAIRSLERSRQVEATPKEQSEIAVAKPPAVDQTLWSPKRVSAYLESLAAQFPPPLAILRIPKIGLEVPVFEGTDELVLNRGVGRIVGTAQPGQPSNMGIAGHRDGFFRGLKDISVGETLTLTTANETVLYNVDRITIVTPQDVSVLEPTPTPSLTLVTCYPFYFIGHAPQRYIVHCTRKERASIRASPSEVANQPVDPKPGG
jgi:sortase A